MNILFASSEVYPLIKTGGLADVSGSLPRAIKNLKHDIRVVLPAYRTVINNIGRTKQVATLTIPGSDIAVHVLQGRLPGSQVRLYLVDAPAFFDRAGGPYSTPEGIDWPDNAARYALFCRVICEIAMNRAGLDWKPDLTHCNDWQTGLTPALLSREEQRPASVFTIHNLAYQGLFKRAEFNTLELPAEWWSMHNLEFYDQMSFIKGGIVFADHVTTVSPSYAREICTPELGCGLDGLLNSRKKQLTGILNGIDYRDWNPGCDPMIARTYNRQTLHRKLENKQALQKCFDLPLRADIPLFGHVGRLVEQKGVDLILELIPELLKRPIQMVFLGTGEPKLEQALRTAQKQNPTRIGVEIGYSEPRSHLLEAGSDVFMMPSRFEPCGLNQLYSLRYGTPPIVRNTGGLSDSVVQASSTAIEQQIGTGFIFDQATPAALLQAFDQTLNLYARPAIWKQLVINGMSQDFSWGRSANKWLSLYQKVLGMHRTQ